MKTVFDYKTELNSLTFSKEEKDHMKKRLLNAAEAAQPKRRHMGRGAIAAIAVAACLTVAAGAATVSGLASDLFAPLYGTAESEIIDRIGYPIGASDSRSGYTITADAVLGDAYHTCIIYTISRDDGEALAFDALEGGTLPLVFTDNDLPGEGGGSSWFFDSEPGDNCIQYVQQFSSLQPIATGKRVTARFGDLYAAGTDGRYDELVAKGGWTLHFKLDYEDMSVTLPLDTGTDFDGHSVTLESCTVSPIGVRLAYTIHDALPSPAAGNGRETAEQEQWHDLVFGSATVTLNLKDGTSMDFGDSMSASSNVTKDETLCTKSALLDQIIPFEDMESITICGETFPIEAE